MRRIIGAKINQKENVLVYQQIPSNSIVTLDFTYAEEDLQLMDAVALNGEGKLIRSVAGGPPTIGLITGIENSSTGKKYHVVVHGTVTVNPIQTW